ncbi:hypothetical protein JOC36_000812 [Weissella uvarum]|nr:hypothetical protein [Weissella uvarum]MBM7617263.1 hypothetical protein [Weissella uvarum]
MWKAKQFMDFSEYQEFIKTLPKDVLISERFGENGNVTVRYWQDE